jgi:hypothetical protein
MRFTRLATTTLLFGLLSSLCGAMEITVGTEPGAMHRTLQEAVDAAPENATIKVGPGVFSGPVRIAKPLTIEGSGWEKTTLSIDRPADKAIEQSDRQLKEKLQNIKSRPEAMKVFAEVQDSMFPPVIRIDGAENRVTLRNLRVSAWARLVSDGDYSEKMINLVQVTGAKVAIENCALVGSPGSGLVISEGADVEVRKSLIAGTGDLGISIGRRAGKAKATVADCDVRNCYHSGIHIGPGSEATIERSRISSFAWHGIRYDDASPTIRGNRISEVARCGIYASGKTTAKVIGNVFHANEMDGISCWFACEDTIEGNTFAGNVRESLAVIGGAKPTVERNIFYDSPIAITTSKVNDAKADSNAVGEPKLSGNLFWKTPIETSRMEAGGNIDKPADEAAKSVREDPGFAEDAKKSFALTDASVAKKKNIGAAQPLTAESPWPLQAEEKAIIPDGPSRDWREWKRPKGQKP